MRREGGGRGSRDWLWESGVHLESDALGIRAVVVLEENNEALSSQRVRWSYHRYSSSLVVSRRNKGQVPSTDSFLHKPSAHEYCRKD